MKKIFVAFLTLDLIIIDQAVKWWIIEFHPLSIYRNNGVVFGFIQNSFLVYSFITFGFLILIWLIVQNKKHIFDFKHIFPIILITAGALSNLIDRFLNGYVIDYMSLWNLNNFNIADLFIIAGVLLYSYRIFQIRD
jgi:signal peptidase II